ncbi:xylosyltransferase oxt-like [Brachionus plicatilis]|uniref:Xylosyltransferase oxt-like n=1 Tax=Brachionus plicatilis TaxID=10195 RepID=A0A3M7RBS7_BRAPC|nr:xylosyltransferase oxt-like [Brachionus plicatilis]
MKKKTIISLILLVSINSIFCVVSNEDIIYQDHENGMDLGCFNDPNSNDLNGLNDTFAQDQHVNRCFEYCEEMEFYYAAIKYLNGTHYACFCGNRYGTASSELVNENFNCSCKCSTSFCGCYNYIRVVAVRVTTDFLLKIYNNHIDKLFYWTKNKMTFLTTDRSVIKKRSVLNYLSNHHRFTSVIDNTSKFYRKLIYVGFSTHVIKD